MTWTHTLLRIITRSIAVPDSPVAKQVGREQARIQLRQHFLRVRAILRVSSEPDHPELQ